MAKKSQMSTKKILHFEGLRGFCALLVFFVHFWPTAGVNKSDLMPFSSDTLFHRCINELSLFLISGDVPVYIFWLMSAHVITIKYFKLTDQKQKLSFLQHSSIKRYFRLIIPVIGSSLIAFILLKYSLFYNQQKIAGISIPQQAWLQQWYGFVPRVFHFIKTTLIDVFFNGNSHYNPVLWTIQIEFLGSFICYGFLGLFGHYHKSLRIYIIIICVLFVAGTFGISYLYYLPFFLGMLYSHIKYDDKLKHSLNLKWLDSIWLPIVLLVVSLVVPPIIDIYKPGLNPNIMYIFRVVIRALGIILLVINSRFFTLILSTRPFVYLGKISFSFYLLHFIILMSLGSYLAGHFGLDTFSQKVIVLLITLATSIVSAILFEYLIDRKSMAVAKKISNKIDQ